MDLITGLWRRFYGHAYLLLAFTALLWGGNTVAGRIAVGQVSPMMIITLRWIIVVIVLGGLCHARFMSEWRALKPFWRRVLLLGTFGFTVYNAIFYAAAHATTAINLGLIQGIVPSFVIVGSRFVYKTQIRPMQTLGLVVALAGVVLVASRGDLAVLTGLDFNGGDVGMVVACVIYAGYTIALRERPPVSGLTFFMAIAIAAFLSSLPLVIYEIATGTAQWPTPVGWLTVLYIAILPSLVAQLLYIRGVQLLGPGRAGLFVNLVPVAAALLGVIILGETFTIYHAAALTLVLGGIWIAESGRSVIA